MVVECCWDTKDKYHYIFSFLMCTTWNCVFNALSSFGISYISQGIRRCCCIWNQFHLNIYQYPWKSVYWEAINCPLYPTISWTSRSFWWCQWYKRIRADQEAISRCNWQLYILSFTCQSRWEEIESSITYT